MKRPITYILYFSTGLFMGLVASRLIPSGGVKAEGPVVQQEAGEGNVLREDLMSQIARQSARIAELEKELEDDALAEIPEIVEVPVELTEEERREAARKRFEERMNERFTSRIGRMTEQYGLDGIQQAALMALYQKQFAMQQARRRGEDVERLDMDAAMQDILNEEQFAEYMAETQKEIYDRAELAATTSTLRLAQNTDLPQESLDMVYETINLTLQETMIARQEGENPDTRGLMEERLSTFLSEEELQQVQRAMRASTGGGGGRGGPGGGNRGGPGPGP